ncbi:hypothetical protein Esi_0050_0026 [Ectocarpus siliculosus]|uniref:Pyrroline-5-carboxylate reductase catalytic N-terminal domain-containing protein n=1 Tax=Ectocarpus siliculosus TaxID=2880 RepID=D7G366_ECTSI|nr:hypothetical protein Esi_0050_0026 [Ectocarpus siliculosus]|eukprot:CBJ26913.1 hypothetical protein Esi_0050_0026 [Ectocarpus siliculosus]
MASTMDGFTRTWRCMDRLNVEDELVQDLTDPNFVLRNVDLAFSCCGQTPAVEEGYLRRKEVQRLICSQCLFVAGFLPPMFKQMAGIDKKSKRMAVGGPLIGIVGAGGQLGSAIVQTFLDYGWKPFRLAVSGRGQKKLRKFEALGVGVFEDVSLLVRAVRLVIVAVGPQHARQVGSTLGENGTASALVMSTLAGISEGSLKRVLGTENLIQARVDIARLDVMETMGNKGLPAAGPTSRVGQAERSNGIKDQCDGDAMKGDSDDWGCGDIATWRAVHERASWHFTPDARAVGKIIETIESFYVEQGLEPVQARQACRDWLLPSVEPAALGTRSHQRANLPRTLSSPVQPHPLHPNLQMKEDGDKPGCERWTPRSYWPPPDLVLMEDVYEQMLRVPYGDAVRESGYQSGL